MTLHGSCVSRPSIMGKIDELLKWTLPEYRERHLFVLRLRIAIFVVFCGFYLYFLHGVFLQTRAVTAVIFGSFALTIFAYVNVLRDRWLLVSFLLELVSDLCALTTIVYLTGGPYSSYYTIYIFYIFAAGVFFSWSLALFISIVTVCAYGLFLLLCHLAIVPPLILKFGDDLPTAPYGPVVNFLFTVSLAMLTVYAVQIANHFSKKRERALEIRNKELAALHRMSSTIRSTLSLRDVIDKVLLSVLEGLDFDSVVMLRFDRTTSPPRVRVSTPRQHPRIMEAESIFGFSLEGLEISLSSLESTVLDALNEGRIVFRRNLIDLLHGLEKVVPEDLYRKAQAVLGVERIVAVPIIASGTVLGAIVGFTRETFVDDESLERLEAFANQVALALEAAELIEKLQKSNEHLEKANRVKSEFLAMMSHELRTPLTAIIGFSELLLEGVMGQLESPQQESVAEIYHNGKDLLELINSLLDLAKIESEKMPLDIRPFSFESLIQRVQRMVDSLIVQKNQRVSVSVVGDIPTIEADERKIQQVILNLLSNAIKFTPPEGSIHMAVRHFKDWSVLKKEATWSRRLNGHQEIYRQGGFEFSITDTGIGIAPDQLEAIFDAFHQGDNTMTRRFGGTGLGLTLAKQFVEMHGGLIWAERPCEEGARFIFVLPRRAHEQTPRKS